MSVSTLQFEREEFVESVAEAFLNTELPVEYLGLGLTERVVMSGIHKSVSRMTRVCQLGVSPSVDDFGTGPRT